MGSEARSDWPTADLAELCERVTSGGTPARSHPEYFSAAPDGHRWVKSSELRDGAVWETSERISDLGLRKSAAKLLPAETVLVAMYGATAGRVGHLKIEAAVNQAVCALVPDPERVDPTFLFHALRTQYETLVAKTAGAAQQNLNAGIVKSLRIAVPELATQRRITAVLTAFDELIEVNRRRVELLDDLARGLYKEWFDGLRFPGHRQLPLVDSAAGPIPRGWSVRPFAELAEFRNGFAFKPEHQRRSGLPIIKIKELKRGVTAATPRCEASAVKPKFLVEPGDLLFSWSADLDVYLWPGESGALNQHLFKVLPADPELGPFLFHALTAALPAFRSRAQGTTMRHIKRSALSEVSVAVPPADLLARFSTLVGPLHAESLVHQQQNARLLAERDLVLPRLLSGRLDLGAVDLGGLPTAVAA